MVRFRISKHEAAKPKDPAANHPGYTPTWRGLTERQWFISLLVASGLLLLLTFRGCVIPSGVGPKSKPTATPTPVEQTGSPETTAQEYTVVENDTLSSIARKTGTDLEALAQVNGIDLNKRVVLRVGQKLKLPGR